MEYFFDYIFDPDIVSPFIFLAFALFLGLSFPYKFKNEFANKLWYAIIAVGSIVYMVMIMNDDYFWEGLGVAVMGTGLYFLGRAISKKIQDIDYHRISLYFSCVAFFVMFVVQLCGVKF